MRSSGFIISSLFLLTIAVTEGARILAYFPTPSISHQVVFRPLTHALAARGHEVVVVTTDPVFPKGKTPANLTEIDVHDISYKTWNDLFVKNTVHKQDILLQVKSVLYTFAKIADLQLQIPEVKGLLKKDKGYFDLLLLEACNRPVMGMAYKFDAPVITFSSFGAVPYQYLIMGAPTHTLLYPTAGRQKLYNLSLFEKAVELLGSSIVDYLIVDTDEFDHEIMRKHFGKDVPTYAELTNKTQMMFLNEHPIWSDNRPVPPSIIYVGGIHQTKAKELPKDIKDLLDSSKHGVIYVSFGTNVVPSMLPPEKIQIMVKVFSELPYDVLWKYDKDTLPGLSNNIKLSKWFPQPDLLKHKNVKLFITQGGLQSTDETIDAAVPVIGIPMLVDQWYNVEKFVHHNFGLQLDITTLTEENLKSSIETVINDISFKNNVTRLRSIMREYPIKPLDLAVWWTEHIIKYGGKHLKAPAAMMKWTEYYEIKLVLIALSILLVIVALLGVFMKFILKIMYNMYITNIKLKTY